ncbi:hypothetical protein [Methylobacterium nigriterrae]|uniref:hypothetical protein n=1 Tax=Methylobacterium nigriterrae TaxID=3127512 RepID=UPI003013EB04
MPDVPIVPVPTNKPDLPPEWIEAAETAAHNLGFSKTLADLSPEHWQLVLASVTDRMRLRGASLPLGWRHTLARQVGRGMEDQAAAHIVALRAKREEIAAHVAHELGLGDLAMLSPADRATVDQQTDETIEGCSHDAAEPVECSDADRTMRRLLSEHRALKELKADEANVRLAEEGEVFAPEDDA